MKYTLRQQGEDVVTFGEERGRQQLAGQPFLLVWDNASAHRTTAVQAALATASIEVVWLPFPRRS